MKAVEIIEKGKADVFDVPKPRLRPDGILVKNVAVALNPTDWKHVVHVGAKSIVGCDWAGIVEEVGEDVKRSFQKGDRVWGFSHGSNATDPETGCFAEYVNAVGDLAMKIPDHMSFEEAAAGGSGILTAGQGLYQEMGLPWPNEPLKQSKYIFIYGASSASGALGVQLAKLSGFDVVAACSPRNFEYVQSLGASKVFDINTPALGAEVRAYTDDKLCYAWDCVGGPKAFPVCSSALASSAPDGQTIVLGTIVSNDDRPRNDIHYTYSLGYTAQGKDFEMRGKVVPGRPDHLDFCKKWVLVAEKLLLEGKWKPHRQEVREGGLSGIISGMEDMKEGKVSGVKLVYRVGDPRNGNE